MCDCMDTGADPSIQDKNGRTALGWAVECGFPEIVEILGSSDGGRPQSGL